MQARVALWLFASFCLIYLGTAKGAIEHVDDAAMLRVTESLLHEGTFAVSPDTPGALQGVDGRWFTRYGIGQSLLAIPFYALGSSLPEVETVPPFDPHGYVRVGTVAFVVTLIGLLSTAASVALLYLTCCALGFTQAGSVAAALALGLGTFAWHYSRTFMSEPPSMLCAILAFYALARFARTHHARWALVSGLAAGALLFFRIGNAVLLPGLALWLGWLLVHRQHRLVPMAAWVAPVAISGTALAAFNAVRFGTPLETGYADQVQAFTTPVFVGLYGLLLSSGKGVFFYAPVLVAGVIGWFWVWRAQPVVASALALLVGAYLVFYARFEWWYGGGPWGPRFLVVILPFACIGIAALASDRLPTAAVIALGGLAVITLAVQGLSLAVPYLHYEARMVHDPVAYERLMWSPAYSPIVEHARSLVRREYPLDIALTYYRWPWLALLQGVAFVAGLVLLLVGAWSAVLQPRDRKVARSAALPA